MKYKIRNRNYKFELAGAETVFVDIWVPALTPFISLGSGSITVRAGYAWDGSSIPLKRAFRALSFGKYDPDKYCKTASLVHDAFYQLMRLQLLSRDNKDAIDRLYERMCIEGGMGKRQAARRYWAVKTFGHLTLKPSLQSERKVFEETS